MVPYFSLGDEAFLGIAGRGDHRRHGRQALQMSELSKMPGSLDRNVGIP
jgi:hypothetical protein